MRLRNLVGKLYFDIQLKKADSVNHRLFACVIKNLCKALLCLLTSITAYILVTSVPSMYADLHRKRCVLPSRQVLAVLYIYRVSRFLFIPECSKHKKGKQSLWDCLPPIHLCLTVTNQFNQISNHEQISQSQSDARLSSLLP